ncbi:MULTISPECIES: COG3942 and LysM peptidoglycan-binding domain-containing protein [Staphylococcus]|uniref:COG3942 and LysM peptidoglycan-binding domain-containing protein n=1 Tax=Staphylococcus sp. GDH8C109P TaxID=2804088 RepID=UPI001AEBCD5A|nr:CHAP domain-containing protein [Staphylococcus sp. GDH8C109P]
MKKGLTFSLTSAALFFGVNGLASADQVYTVKEDTDLSNIAQAFATTTNTIQSLNHMEFVQSVKSGQTLILPDKDIVEVKEGDTLQGIANKHQISLNELYQLNPYITETIHPGQLIAVSERGSSHLNNQFQSTYAQNDLESTSNSDQFTVGVTTKNNNTITKLANRSLPVKQQSWSNDSIDERDTTSNVDNIYKNGYQTKYYAAQEQKHFASGGQNYYGWGQCTYYAFDRRQQLGKSVGALWGNANNWASAARQNGYVVNSTPEVGAILQSNAGNYGHVGIVERQNSDGSILVSEMNWRGVGQKSYRTIYNSGQYNYIH